MRNRLRFNWITASLLIFSLTYLPVHLPWGGPKFQTIPTVTPTGTTTSTLAEPTATIFDPTSTEQPNGEPNTPTSSVVRLSDQNTPIPSPSATPTLMETELLPTPTEAQTPTLTGVPTSVPTSPAQEGLASTVKPSNGNSGANSPIVVSTPTAASPEDNQGSFTPSSLLTLTGALFTTGVGFWGLKWFRKPR